MLIAVLSVKGSPGVTTFAVALAARWPAPVRPVLVEADPSGGDIGIRFSLKSTPGLVSMAAAARRSDDPGLLWQHAQLLPGGLAVVAAPPDADRARTALSALSDSPDGAGLLRDAANGPDTVAIVDCGRIDAGSVAMPIVRSADAMVLLTRAHADDLAHLARRLPIMGRWTPHPAMLLVGEGYSPDEVAGELGVPVLCRVPDDPRGAAALCGRPTARRERRGPVHSVLGQVAHKVAKALIAEQASSAAFPRQSHSDRHAVPITHSVHSFSGTPVSADGLESAPPAQQIPHGPEATGTSRGGHAS